MTATFHVGDAIEVMGKLPEKSVDLVLTSPPFWSLRSYLPADHESKALEGGSEATPGEYVDWLIDVVEACDRVLAPHGSLCVELGDTYSGSGGAGGDYLDNGWRNGQPKFGGSASHPRESAWSFADAKWLAGVIDTEGSIHVHRTPRKPNPSYVIWMRITMMDREVCDQAARISGVGHVTQDKRGAFTWACSAQQARYVLLHIWPYLLIKERQARACIELARHIEESERRGRYAPLSEEQLTYREMIKAHVTGWNYRGDQRGTFPTTWEPPTPPHIRSSLQGGPSAAMPKSLSLIPELFRLTLVYGTNLLTGRQTERWRLRNVVRWVRPNPPVGALGDKFRPATSELMVFCKSAKRYFDLDSVREPYSDLTMQVHGKTLRGEVGGINGPKSSQARSMTNQALTHAGAPPLDWWNVPPGGYSGTVMWTARKPVDPRESVGDIWRTTSADCPVHADQPDQAPTAPHDEPISADRPARNPGKGANPAPRPLPGSAPTDPLPWPNPEGGTSDSPPPDSKSAATRRSKASNKKGRAPATTTLDIASDRTFDRTGDTSTALRSAEPHPDTPENRTSMDGQGEAQPGSSDHIVDTSVEPFDEACTCSYWVAESQSTSHYAVFPPELCIKPIKSMCPEKVCKVCGEPSRREVDSQRTVNGVETNELIRRPNATVGSLAASGGGLDGRGHGATFGTNRTTTGWSDCGHDDWRPGVVLDPFGGSGTTALVATGHGRDCILIDLDERNYELALQRVGPFILSRAESV